MWYPKLVRCARTSVRVVIEDENPNEFGERESVLDNTFKCNFQEKSGVSVTTNKQEVTSTAAVLIPGDICPETERLSTGYVEIKGIRRHIVSGSKWRNPDGTVNYCRLDVE